MNLALEQTRGVLYSQQGVASALDGKLTALFGFATAILGIGAPGILSKAESISVTPAMVVVLVSYLLVIFYSFWGLRPQPFKTTDHPVLLEKLSDMPEAELSETIWQETKSAWSANDGVLKMKSGCVNRVALFLVARTFATIFWAYVVFSAAASSCTSS